MGSTVQCNSRINPELREKFNEYCRQQGISQNNGIETAIRLLVIGEEKAVYPNAKSEMDAILTSINIISENSTHLAQRLEHEKFINDESQKTALLNLDEQVKLQEEKIKQQEDALNASERTIDELKRQIDHEVKKASLCEREKNVAIAEKKNMQDTHTITLKKIADLESRAETTEKLEKEIVELKESLKQAYDTISELSRNKDEISRRYFASRDEKDVIIDQLKTRLDILETQLRQAGLSPIE